MCVLIPVEIGMGSSLVVTSRIAGIVENSPSSNGCLDLSLILHMWADTNIKSMLSIETVMKDCIAIWVFPKIGVPPNHPF